MKGEELRAAEAHIARLEEELLRLKDVKHDLQVAAGRTSTVAPQRRRAGDKILSAPFRLFRRRQRTDANEQDEYGRWFARHRVSAEEAAKLREQSRTFSYRPLLSILMPTFNPNDEFLTAAVESVIAQVYENWELILIDDGSGDSRARALLKNLGQRDARIQIGVARARWNLLSLKHGAGAGARRLDRAARSRRFARARCVVSRDRTLCKTIAKRT